MRIFVNIVKWLVGLLFIFSGLIKIIDPIGFSIKLTEYFEVFNLHFLNDYTLLFSVFITMLEVLLGVFLLLGLFKKLTLISLILLIVFFTFLTFYSAYFNVVQDCGCFGDAIKLTPWQSFYKDLILLTLILILCFGRGYLSKVFSKPITFFITFLSLIVTSFVAYRGVYHLPIKDFRPYAVGENIRQGMKTAEEMGKIPPQIEMTYNLKNKTSGDRISLNEQEYISEQSYWSSDSDWELINTEEQIVNEGYVPPIHDFGIDCSVEGDMTDYYLNLPRLILITSSNPDKASKKGIDKLIKFSSEMKKLNIPVLIVSAGELNIKNVKTCFMDATTLKTIIRSNPGVVFLDKGTVKAKFHWRDIPESKEIEKYFQ